MRVIFKLIFSILIVVFSIKPVFAIKIGLLTNVSSTPVAVSLAGYFIDGNTNREIYTYSPMQTCIITSNGSKLAAKINGKSYGLGTNYLIIKPGKNGFVFTKKKWYRGNLVIYRTSLGITVINDVDMESYLKGVVPAEMPSKWNIEAHKAQAIAARSYAIANLGKRRKYGYDLKDTPEDQAYGGASRETIKTNTAVAETKGQVLVYGNKVIPAYYHASAGGYTVQSGDVWYRDLPFVRAVPSFDGMVKKNGHGVGMSQWGAKTLADYGYNAYQILGYFYQNVKLYILNL